MERITACIAILLLCLLQLCLTTEANEGEETRPYEFSFNIQDFQHRYEKKSSDGIVTGEYGFITADGVYHETGYATDKNGDFIITKMRNRKITSLEVAQEIFKGKPEVAKRVIQVLAKSCSGCGIPVNSKKENNVNDPGLRTSDEKRNFPFTNNRMEAAAKEMMNVLSRETVNQRNQQEVIKAGIPGQLTYDGKLDTKDIISKMVTAAKKKLENEIPNDVRSPKSLSFENSAIERMADDLFYRFNYTITSHGHQEAGYRSGKKDGSYRSVGINNTDAIVDYLSNEFGHQPNITFMNRVEPPNAEVALKGFSFEWIYDKH